MHIEPRSNCAHSVLLQSHSVFGVFPRIIWITTSFKFCIPIVFAYASFHFSSHSCPFDTLHFTALNLALAMALDDQLGAVPDSQPLLGLHRPVCTVKRFANRAARTAPYLGSAPSSFCPPTPKAPGLPTPQLLCRWSQGRFSPDYRPRGLSPVESVGLSPPLRESRFQFRGVLPTGGLAVGPSTLGIHRPGIQPLITFAPRPKVVAFTSFHPPMMGSLPQPAVSQPVTGVTPSNAAVTTMLHMHDQLKLQHLQLWLSVLHDAGPESELFVSTSDSAHASELRMKAVSRFAPSTMASYLRMWAQWKAFCECQAVSAFRPAPLNVVDFLHVHSRASAQGLAAGYIRALTWVSKYAGFPVLLSCLQAPLAKSYAVASAPVPRREAAPLPLSFVIWLETCILKSIGTSADRLVMGGILVLIWSSLRWSDAQWISPCHLLEDQDSLRGLAHRTKSTSRGMPFGLLRCGFLGHTVDVPWCSLWLNLVRTALHHTAQRHRGLFCHFGRRRSMIALSSREKAVSLPAGRGL